MPNATWFKSVFVRQQLRDLRAEMLSDSVFDGAAALAFYLTLAVFPGLIFLLTLLPYLPLPDLYGMLNDEVITYLPSRAASALQATAFQVLENKNASIMSLSFIGGLYAASSGSLALVKQMNIALAIRETRSFVHTRLIALGLTVVLSFVLIGSLLIMVVGSMYMSGFILTLLRWVVMLIMVYSALSIVYTYAPNLKRAGRLYGFLNIGAILATILILLTTLGFSWYVYKFDSYNKIYGSLAGIMILMVWFYLVGIAILMGAELNDLTYKKQWFLKLGLRNT